MKVNLVFKKTYLFLCVCVGAYVCVYVYVPCVCRACGDEKLASDSLELELTDGWELLWVLEPNPCPLQEL